MSEISFCEKDIQVDAFLADVAAESALIVTQKIPLEYRTVYLSSYAAGLMLNSDLQFTRSESDQEKVCFRRSV